MREGWRKSVRRKSKDSRGEGGRETGKRREAGGEGGREREKEREAVRGRERGKERKRVKVGRGIHMCIS